MKKKKHHYTVHQKRKTLIPAIIVVFLSVLFVSIISLLPKRDYYLGNTNTLGVGRKAVYPFVFYDSTRTLYLLDEENTIKVIDDSVYSQVHDQDFGNVYYLRNTSLFMYSTEKNSRVELCTDIRSFRLMNDRKAVVCFTETNEIKMYNLATGEYVSLSKAPLPEEADEKSFVLGDSHILFLDNFSENAEIENAEADSEKKADLMISNENGTVSKIHGGISYEKGFYISSDDTYAAFYEEETLYVTNLKGETVHKLPDCTLSEITDQNVLMEPTTRYLQSSETVPFTYVVKEADGRIDLQYLKNKKVVEIDTDIEKIVELSSGGYCFYTKDAGTTDENGNRLVDLYMSVSGTKKRKIETLPADSNFIYDEYQGYIYFQTPDTVLSRVYVKDRKLKTVKVADTSGTLSVYKNRPFVSYKDVEGTDNYIILDSNVVERYTENEARLYGSSTNKYLIFKKNGPGNMVVSGLTSLDLYNNGTLTRISNAVIKDHVFFDKDFNNIIFYSSGKMMIWNSGKLTELAVNNLFFAADILE